MISTPSSLACEPLAQSSLARWSATKTAIGSATPETRRGSSSSWRSRSAEGSGRPPNKPRQRHWSSRTPERIAHHRLGKIQHPLRPGDQGMTLGYPILPGHHWSSEMPIKPASTKAKSNDAFGRLHRRKKMFRGCMPGLNKDQQSLVQKSRPYWRGWKITLHL